jgi:UDP-glucuronate 4-epimerase
LLEVARLFQIQNFVYASSSSVYGLSKSTKFREDEVCDKPVSPYAATKRSIELLAHSYSASYNLNVTGLRFFTVFGPRGRPDMAPFKFVDRVSQGKPIDMFGDGSTSRDYTYVQDIVIGVVRAIDRPHKTQLFNLGQGGGCKLSEFIELVEKHTCKKANINRMPMQLGDVPYTSADVSKAYCYLGYVPTVTLDEGLKKTVEWYNSTYLKQGGYDVQKKKSEELSGGVGISSAF